MRPFPQVAGFKYPAGKPGRVSFAAQGRAGGFYTLDYEPGSFAPRESEFKAALKSLRSETPGEARAREELALNPPRSPQDIFPVPIRDDLVVYIQNVPLDMTVKEADKIAAVVRALANPDTGEES